MAASWMWAPKGCTHHSPARPLIQRSDAVINLFAFAIRHNLTAKDLQTTMFAYPTGASDIGHMVHVGLPTGIQNIEHRAVRRGAVRAVRDRFRQDGFKLDEIGEFYANVRQMCTRDLVHVGTWSALRPS